jgi:agmatinase
MRRASEKSYVSGITHIGIRNVSSTARDGYIAAKEKGSTIFSVRQFRKIGIAEILKNIPKNVRYYLTIDIDAFDPSIAAGTGTPSHGGFYYYEILEFIDGLTKQGKVTGLDLVEVAPDYDITNSTSTLAAQLLMNVIGRILHSKK